MLKLFYRFVTPWAISNDYQKKKNKIIGRIVNRIYPIYCFMFPLRNVKNIDKKDEIVVSLTSFPARIQQVYLCINSILRQEYKADKVILWLAKSQFEDKLELPKKLLNLEKKGLEIRFCDDLKSYKKIFYTAQEYKDSIIITADDDVLYPEDWVKKLVETHKKYKDCIVCYRAHEITFDEKNNINLYCKWKDLSPNQKGPSLKLVAIGVGGILYPKNAFENIKFDWGLIERICPTTDDLWLKIIMLKKGYKVVKVYDNSKEWFAIKNTQGVKLFNENKYGGKNDIALKNLIDYYNIIFYDE